MIRRVLLAIVVGLASACVASSAWAESVTIAAAISLKDAMTEVGQAYEKQASRRAVFQFGSSGQLAAQIRQGAPVDVFISAASQPIDELAKDQLIDKATVRTIAGNSLVLIAPADAKQAPNGFEELSNQRIQRIAIGNPPTVPAGEYAMQVLKAIKLDEALKDRLVFGANVRQVLNYVERGEVDAGIVYATDALIAGDKVKIIATADPKLHQPIEYPAAIVSASKNTEQARQFLTFLASDVAKKVLQKHGFTSLPANAK